MKARLLVKLKPENGKLRIEIWLFDAAAITCYILEGTVLRMLTKARVLH